MSQDEQTHFGFRQVPLNEKAQLVRGVFDSVASKYDVMNDLMSFGIHRIWKQIAGHLSCVRSGEAVLDIAGGTGDMAKLFHERVGPKGHVVLADINAAMLQQGRDRLINDGIINGIAYVQADAERLPFADQRFDCVSIAFGLRNVTNKDAALASMFRVLKPGGRLIVLEFSQIRSELLKKIYDAYSFHVMPRIGQWVANDGESYRYLAESIRMHPDQDVLKRMLETAGFERTEYFNLSQGIVAVHRGYRL